MARVIFVDATKKAPKPLYARVAWYLVAIGAVIAFATFVYRPDLIIWP